MVFLESGSWASTVRRGSPLVLTTWPGIRTKCGRSGCQHSAGRPAWELAADTSNQRSRFPE